MLSVLTIRINLQVVEGSKIVWLSELGRNVTRS